MKRVAHIQNLWFKLPEGFVGSEKEITDLIAKQLKKKVKCKKSVFDFDEFMKNDEYTMCRSFEILEPHINIVYEPSDYTVAEDE